jgi:hypothetical protein
MFRTGAFSAALSSGWEIASMIFFQVALTTLTYLIIIIMIVVIK